MAPSSPLAFAHPAVRRWFEAAFEGATEAQRKGWPPIAAGKSTLLLAPTGSGKTLAAFLAALDRLMFEAEAEAGGNGTGTGPGAGAAGAAELGADSAGRARIRVRSHSEQGSNSAPPDKRERCRVLYISPLKALGVDVERNLHAPIAGIRAAAERAGEAVREIRVGVRTGDTPQSERARMLRTPPDILITTPESLYLLLTSRARDTLRSVETVIVDEIHSLVESKRGAHLFVSLERLEAARRPGAPPLQRIGLSATQRPLEEVARLLGGGTLDGQGSWRQRPVEIVDAGRTRALELTVEVPVEDMARLGDPSRDDNAGPVGDDPNAHSIWPSIHPRLVALIREHRSTMIFVNSRRLAERLAGALNEEAGEDLALAHHGSLSKEKRSRVEELLKSGELPAIVATSSLELGIDMGAVDLVIQIEAPPSVASGIQRIGRAGHQVGALSRGVVFPKHRGDLLACAAATPHMRAGRVEATHYPRNPLDILAQQIVAEISVGECTADTLFDRMRGAAPFAELPRSAYEGVLDMLSGRYPSDEFAELRPRITWDRLSGRLDARHGAGRIAIVNGGTIPDRGLYGVFLADSGAGAGGAGSRRVGELDEEMVYESRPGEVFLLGASSWRIQEITQDRVNVVPAPGEPGRMPFWRGDRPGRAAEFGAAIGALARTLAHASEDEGSALLAAEHGLDPDAARNLVRYVAEQRDTAGAVPTDRTIVFERFVDEVGDWRVCILSPFGARVHQPWATAVRARLIEREGIEADVVVADDGIVFRLPESEGPPDPALFFPAADEVEGLVVRALADTSLFALRFRENAARALLLPRKFPSKRVPLWAQRRKSSDLLKVAARFDQFPIILETYRECLRDVFDLPALKQLLGDIAARRIQIAPIETRRASPFASSLLFAYVGNFLYDGDAPLAERRAQILSIDHAQLRELLGEAELRTLLDADAIAELAGQLQRRRAGAGTGLRHADALHDLLLGLGDLSRAELAERTADEQPGELDTWLADLTGAHRIARLEIAGEPRYVAAEDLGRLRDALGVSPPPGFPEAFLEPVVDPLADLVSRYARTHTPFHAEAAASRLGLGVAPVLQTLQRLAAADRVVEGEFLPNGQGREWCDGEVLRRLKQKSLARLRKQVEPVEQATLGRFLPKWHGLVHPRRGIEALLGVIEQLQGLPLPASVLESEILPARIDGYAPSLLDELCAAGEVLWRGIEPIGARDGRIALFLSDHYDLLAPPTAPAEGAQVEAIRALLRERGATFFPVIAEEIGGFPGDLVSALWQLAWAGEITNDTLTPLRSLLREGGGGAGAGGAMGSGAGRLGSTRPGRSGRGAGRVRARTRRVGPPGTEGRWSLLPGFYAGLSRSANAVTAPNAATPAIQGSSATLGDTQPGVSETERRTALVRQLLERHGVLVREAVHAENIPGGFSAVYPVLKAMEEAGTVRRGYFIAGLGATQFALPGADEQLRRLREPVPGNPGLADSADARAGADGASRVLAATDPANPYGAALRWPEPRAEGVMRPGRSAGAQVLLHEGVLVGYLGRTEKTLLTFLPEAPAERTAAARSLAGVLGGLASGPERRRSVLLEKIDGREAADSELAPLLVEAGFEVTRDGLRFPVVGPGRGRGIRR